MTFIENSLPPGDREEARPPAAHSQSSPGMSSADPVAGRKPEQPLLPGLALPIEQIGTTMDELQMALGDLKLGQAQGDWPTFEATAYRLQRLSTHVAKTITDCRPRERAPKRT